MSLTNDQTHLDLLELSTVADTIERNGGWHIAAVKVRAAIAEIGRLTSLHDDAWKKYNEYRDEAERLTEALAASEGYLSYERSQVERLRSERDRWKQSAREWYFECRGQELPDEPRADDRGVVYMPCERHRSGTYTMTATLATMPIKAVCPGCESEKSTCEHPPEAIRSQRPGAGECLQPLLCTQCGAEIDDSRR